MRKLILFSLFFLSLAPITAYAIGMEVSIGGWNSSAEGDISYASDDILDLENDLKYDEEFRMMGRVKLDMPIIPNIYLMATPMEFEGIGEKSTDFKFGDVTFDGNKDFHSKLTLHHYDIALYYGIPFMQLVTLETFDVEVGINLRLVDLKAEIRQDETGRSESKSYTLPVPMLYAAAHVRPIKAISAEAEVRGVTYDGNHFYSLIGRLKANIFGPLFAAGGYRYEDISFDEKDVEADVIFSGPFFEMGFQF